MAIESSFHKEVDLEAAQVDTRTASDVAGQQHMWTRDASAENLNIPRVSPSTANHYKRSISPKPRDSSAEGRLAPNEILSDSLGGMTPLDERQRAAVTAQQYVSYLQNSGGLHVPLSMND